MAALRNSISPKRKKARQRITQLQNSVGCSAMLHIVRGSVKDALFGRGTSIVGRRTHRWEKRNWSLSGRLRDLTYGGDSRCAMARC